MYLEVSVQVVVLLSDVRVVVKEVRREGMGKVATGVLLPLVLMWTIPDGEWTSESNSNSKLSLKSCCV